MVQTFDVIYTVSAMYWHVQLIARVHNMFVPLEEWEVKIFFKFKTYTLLLQLILNKGKPSPDWSPIYVCTSLMFVCS